MIQKGIASTTHKDLQGDILTKECLTQMADDINNAPFATGAGVDHDLLALPIGKTISAEVVPLDDGEFALNITQEMFENYRIVKLNNGERYVKSNSLTDTRPYANLFDDTCSDLTISVGSVNFSEESYKEFCNSLDESIKLQANIRKSIIPDPEIIITLAVGTFFLNTTKGIAEKVSVDMISIYDVIKRTIKNYSKYINPNQRIPTYVFQDFYNDIAIQMIVKSDDLDIVMFSIAEENLKEIVTKVNDICTHLQPDKMQFCFEPESNKWKITHFTTENGEIFGTKETYRYTKRLLSKYRGLKELNLTLAPRTDDE